MEFEPIAEATRVTARISLVLFCVFFVVDAGRTALSARRASAAAFIVAHVVHLGFVAAYFAALGEPPKVSPVLGLLVAGVVALIWLTVRVVGRAGPPVAPAIVAWFLWFLFAATHISRLLDPERAGAVNWALLVVTLIAAAARVRVGLGARRAV